MDDKPIDKESAEWQWRKYFGSQRVEDALWRSTSHGPEWTQKEIKEAVNEVLKNLKRIKYHTSVHGSVEDFRKNFAPDKTVKKKLIEYIKRNL